MTFSDLNGQLPPAEQAAIAIPVVVLCSMLIAALVALLLVCHHKRKTKRELKKNKNISSSYVSPLVTSPLICITSCNIPSSYVSPLVTSLVCMKNYEFVGFHWSEIIEMKHYDSDLLHNILKQKTFTSFTI